jgi:hypothetical protein
MTDVERKRLRRKQDTLISLVKPESHHLHLTTERHSPTIEDLKHAIYPKWEGAVDGAIEILREGK